MSRDSVDQDAQLAVWTWTRAVMLAGQTNDTTANVLADTELHYRRNGEHERDIRVVQMARSLERRNREMGGRRQQGMVVGDTSFGLEL